jgi:hypothetical protein
MVKKRFKHDTYIYSRRTIIIKVDLHNIECIFILDNATSLCSGVYIGLTSHWLKIFKCSHNN